MFWMKKKQAESSGPTDEKIVELFTRIKEFDSTLFGLTKGQIGEIAGHLRTTLEGTRDMADFGAALCSAYALEPRKAGALVGIVTETLYPEHLDRLRR